MGMACSSYQASDEYPTGIFCDTPGAAGVWTYSLHARVGAAGGAAPVVVGYSGTITAILLPTSVAPSA